MPPIKLQALLKNTLKICFIAFLIPQPRLTFKVSLSTSMPKPTRILIAPDKFKGSLTAAEAAHAIKRGVKQVWPDADVRVIPIADGGEGTADLIRSVRGGEWISTTVRDPLGRPVHAQYLWLADTATAVIDMSAASGLWRSGFSHRCSSASSVW